jgi:hypothetical protein
MMIELGLLARHPYLRSDVLVETLSTHINFGQVNIVAFNGRNNLDNYIWGEISGPLGKEAIRPFWVNNPKDVDQFKWKEIIGNKPTLDMFDEEQVWW